jgi:hypothetical protein
MLVKLNGSYHHSSTTVTMSVIRSACRPPNFAKLPYLTFPLSVVNISCPVTISECALVIREQSTRFTSCQLIVIKDDKNTI